MQTDAATEGSSNYEGSKWPAPAMLALGTFGGRTPAARRYHTRCAIALIGMLVLELWAGLLLIAFPNATWRVVLSLVPGVSFFYIAWEFRRYLLALDELARRIQLEAIAWTYLTGLAVAVLVGGVAAVYGGQWNRLWLNPMWFVFLEPLRGCFLYYTARRY
jgi:hypothetical protein